jgi:hypothetical protein
MVNFYNIYCHHFFQKKDVYYLSYSLEIEAVEDVFYTSVCYNLFTYYFIKFPLSFIASPVSMSNSL